MVQLLHLLCNIVHIYLRDTCEDLGKIKASITIPLKPLTNIGGKTEALVLENTTIFIMENLSVEMICGENGGRVYILCTYYIPHTMG